MQLTGAEIIVECLKEQGVDTVFGYPGGAILNVYDALYEYKDQITHVLTPMSREHPMQQTDTQELPVSRRVSCNFRPRSYQSGNRNRYRIHGFRTNGGNHM